MKILGIDPSYAKGMAYGVLNQKGELLDSGVLSVEKKGTDLSPHEKALKYQSLLSSFMLKHKITHLACEDQYSGKNVDGFKKLVLVTGGVISAAILENIPYELYIPASWRKLTYGKGNMKKVEGIELIIDHYGLVLKKKDYDIAEAIGIAYAVLVKEELAPEIEPEE